MLYLKNPYSFLKHIIIIPLISTVIIPLILMDIWMEIYHRICFPLYGMPYIKRSDYITIMDRAKLPYLNILQKLYCMYCGYGNGGIFVIGHRLHEKRNTIDVVFNTRNNLMRV